MRLLDTCTGQFVEKDPEEEDIYGHPKLIYAILSHTWDKEGEQTYKELKKIQQRYGPGSQVSQNPPTRGSENVTSSSPEQVRDEPSPMLSPFRLRSDSVSETTPLITPPKHSKSWFARRIARLKWLCQCRSARNIEPGSSEATVRTPVDVPSPDDPPVPPANDPHGAASSDPAAPSPGGPPPQTTRLPTALGRFTHSEVEALFRVFVEPELYGLPDRNPPSAPSAEHQPPSRPRSVLDDPDLSPKIRDACTIARENGYDYIWIDSCCIDKSSSSELSEAINSMYKWYHLADVCYAYLADVPQPGEDNRAEGSCFRKSRWFTRGWTLQELIAPARVEFLAQDWSPIGSKRALVDLVESITKIHYKGLLQLEPLDTFSVAQRLSWAAERKTTRKEDWAYSLLGIFDINMPTLYGEGDRAFRRLQEEIMQRIPDQSLFAWGDIYLPGLPQHKATEMFDWATPAQAVRWSIVQSHSLFVRSPYGFKDSENIHHVQLPPSLRYEIEYTLTPLGIRTRFQMIPFTHDLLSSMFPLYSDIKLRPSNNARYLAILGCEHDQHPGHFLGRLCYTRPSESNIESLDTGPVLFSSKTQHASELPDLFPLSPETIEHRRPHIELKTVYIPLPQSYHTYPGPLESLQMQPYTAFKLLMLKGTCDTLRSRGYSANLRDPNPDHPTAGTHWLTLSKAEQTVTVELQHTLHDDGKWFVVISEVRESDQRGRGAVYYWQDYCPWVEGLAPKIGGMSADEVGVLSVDVNLQFLGHGFYSIVIDVSSDAPPAPPDMPVELAPLPAAAPSALQLSTQSATEQAAVRGTGDGSRSGVRVINAGDEAGQEEAGGCGTASAEARDRWDSASDGAGSEDSVGSKST